MSEPEVWHVLIKDGETVSLLKNLTASVCAETVRRLCPNTSPWQDDLIAPRAHWEADPDGYRAKRQVAHASYAKHMAYMSGSGGYVTLGQTHMLPSLEWQEPTPYYAGVQWWGPDDEELEIWPEPPEYAANYAKALAAVRTAATINRKIEETVNGHR